VVARSESKPASQRTAHTKHVPWDLVAITPAFFTMVMILAAVHFWTRRFLLLLLLFVSPLCEQAPSEISQKIDVLLAVQLIGFAMIRIHVHQQPPDR
jgi:hypothetical protein